MSYKTTKVNNRVARLLQAGKVGLLPADTIYGLSCVALNERAVKRLHQIKKRDKNKPFIVLISQISQLEDIGLTSIDAGRALHYWPGKLTVICESKNAPSWLEIDTGSVAVRQPANKDLLALIEKTGPLVSTSANLAGNNPAKTAKQAEKYFDDKLDFYVDVGMMLGRPSTLVKPIFGKLKVIRQGAVKVKKKDLL